MRSVASVCICLVWALTFESVEMKLHFWYAGTFSEYLGQVPASGLLGQGHSHRSKTCPFVGGMPLTKRQTCYTLLLVTTGWRRINRTIQPVNRVYKNLHKMILTLVAHRQIRR